MLTRAVNFMAETLNLISLCLNNKQVQERARMPLLQKGGSDWRLWISVDSDTHKAQIKPGQPIWVF